MNIACLSNGVNQPCQSGKTLEIPRWGAAARGFLSSGADWVCNRDREGNHFGFATGHSPAYPTDAAAVPLPQEQEGGGLRYYHRPGPELAIIRIPGKLCSLRSKKHIQTETWIITTDLSLQLEEAREAAHLRWQTENNEARHLCVRIVPASSRLSLIPYRRLTLDRAVHPLGNLQQDHGRLDKTH